MARAEKVAAVAELTDRFNSAAGTVLTEYRGLSVAQLAELRRSLGEHATFSVVKNTLTKIAASQAGVPGEITEQLVGPSAIAFVQGDVVEAAKGLRDFSRTHPFLVIKGGVVEGKLMTPTEITRLADLEPREVLLAKLAGAMKASMSGAAATFAALPVQMARLLKALEDKLAADAPAAEASEPAAAETGASAEAVAEVTTAAAESPEAASAESPGAAPEESPAAAPDASPTAAPDESPAAEAGENQDS